MKALHVPALYAWEFNTIHSLISLKNFADALRGRNAHPKKIFSNKGMIVENVENRGQIFLMMT